MLLQIDGWFGAGKGVLWKLLDGHPEVFVSPVHEFFYAVLLDQSNTHEWITTRHSEVLRKVMARSQYFMLEKVSYDGYQTWDLSVNDRITKPFHLDFYALDKRFMQTVMQEPVWTLEFIAHAMYESLRLTNYPDYPTPRYYASLSKPEFIAHYHNIPIHFPGSKSVQVRRKVENILATRSSRQPRPEDFKTNQFYSDPLAKRIADGEIEKMLHYYQAYDHLVEQSPQHFSVIAFEDLILRTEQTMRGVADFLGITYDPILSIATDQGEEMIFNGKKYVGQELDDISQLLSPEEITLIRDRVDAWCAANHYDGKGF